VGAFFWSRSEEGGVAFDRQVFRVPLLGDTLLKFQASQFCRTLSTLLTGGTRWSRRCKRRRIDQQPIGACSVKSATQMVREGESLHSALASGQVMPSLHGHD